MSDTEPQKQHITEIPGKVSRFTLESDNEISVYLSVNKDEDPTKLTITTSVNNSHVGLATEMMDPFKDKGINGLLRNRILEIKKGNRYIGRVGKPVKWNGPYNIVKVHEDSVNFKDTKMVEIFDYYLITERNAIKISTWSDLIKYLPSVVIKLGNEELDVSSLAKKEEKSSE